MRPVSEIQSNSLLLFELDRISYAACSEYVLNSEVTTHRHGRENV